MKTNNLKMGFTLIEVLAVIAILSMLVVLTLPRVRTHFENAKKNTFLIETKKAVSISKEKYMKYLMQGEELSEITSEGEYNLDLENDNLKYCIELNGDGNVARLQASNGKYYINIDGSKDISSYDINSLEKRGYESLYCVVDEAKTLKGLLLKNNIAYPDDKSSKYVRGKNGIDFNKPASLTNGMGFYYNYNSDDINKDGKIDKTYYFRGLVDNNNVIFGDSCYLVLGISEDGAVRMLYNGESYNGYCSIDNYSDIDISYYNNLEKLNAYVGYKYGEPNLNSYTNEHANLHNSNIKETIDSWYKDNIIYYSKYIQDTVYCNDRSVNNKSLDGYGKHVSNFNSVNRFTKNTQPTFKCENKNDKFTVNSNIGNGALDYPVGTITADEYIYSGGVYTTQIPIKSKRYDSNNNIKKMAAYYSYDNSATNTFINNVLWTMTPSKTGEVFVSGLDKTFSMDINKRANIVPVISLSDKAYVKYGNGSGNSPYVIDTEKQDDKSKCLSESKYKKGTIKYKMLKDNCAYPDNVSSVNVTLSTGINYGYTSGKDIPVKYKSYSYYTDWGPYFNSYSTYKFYKSYIFDSKTGKYKLSGDFIEGKWNTNSICSENSCPVADYYYSYYGDIYKIKSFKDSNHAYGDYYKSTVDTYGWNGKGLYYTNNKNIIENNTPVLFYRGNVINNYVMIKNNCYRIIRTDANGNVKLVFNNSGKCKIDNFGIKSEYSYATNDNAYVGYMYGNLEEKKSSNLIRMQIFRTWDYYYSSDYIYDKKTNKYKLSGNIISGHWGTDGVCSSKTCPVKNYYTCLGGSKSDTCDVLYKVEGYTNSVWRYSGDSYETIRGYYINLYSQRYSSTSYSKAHENIHSSKVKDILDKWYKDNKLDKVNAIVDSVYCNDRSVSNGLGFGEERTTYSFSDRKIPTYKCKQKNDKFTVNSNMGNGKLIYPVGLLTGDEIKMSGKLYDDYGISMTPESGGSYIDLYNSNYRDLVYPVITISGSSYVLYGRGTIKDPYVIE